MKKNSFKMYFKGLTLIGLMGAGVFGNAAEDAKVLVDFNLEQALKLAHTCSPELRSAWVNWAAAKKGSDAAGLWENPKIKLEAEGVGGDNDYDSGEYAVALVQELQIPAVQTRNIGSQF